MPRKPYRDLTPEQKAKRYASIQACKAKQRLKATTDPALAAKLKARRSASRQRYYARLAASTDPKDQAKLARLKAERSLSANVYKKAHPEKVAVYNARYKAKIRAKNKESHKAAHRAWYQANKEEQNAKRRARYYKAKLTLQTAKDKQ